MTRLAVVLCFTLGLGLSVEAITHAQTSGNIQPKQANRKQSSEPRATHEKRAREMRAFALQMTSALADEARGFKDESLRARVQARAADVLWDADQELARVLFDRAWEAAQIVDNEGRRRNDEERRRFLSGRGGTGFIPPPPNLRAEVLRLASLHDRALAEKYLAKMEEDNKRAEEENKTKRDWDPTEPPEAVAKRLQLARQLLENGQFDTALTLAQSGLNRVTSDGIIFLILLRQKNAAIADQLFASLLNRTAGDPLSDATSVSLLSSYVLTPSVLVTSTRNGLLMNPWTSMLPPPQLSPALHAKFFSVAGQVLMRPVSPSELESTSAGIAGTYFTIKRLLPFFEQSSPLLAAALQSKLNVLAQGRDGIIPGQQHSFVNAGFDSKKTEEVEPDDTLSRIEQASSTRERNHLYAIAAQKAAMKNDLKARELADKIEDDEFRRDVRNFVDVIIISKALEKRESEKALQLARTGVLSHFQRVWSYTEIAGLLKSSTQEQAISLITQAMEEAERMKPTNAESAEARVAIATSAVKMDQTGKEDLLLDVVKAVNRAADYTGEENSFTVDFRSGNSIAKVSIPAPTISLANLFAALAKDDVYRAANIANAIKNESPRAIALLASARSVLETKPN